MDRRRFLLTSLAGVLAASLTAAAPPAPAQGLYFYVYVEGEVRKPGAVTFSTGMTLKQGIALAGGFTATASIRDIELTRGSKTTRVDARDVLVLPPIDPELRPGDVIRVHARFF